MKGSPLEQRLVREIRVASSSIIASVFVVGALLTAATSTFWVLMAVGALNLGLALLQLWSPKTERSR